MTDGVHAAGLDGVAGHLPPVVLDPVRRALDRRDAGIGADADVLTTISGYTKRINALQGDITRVITFQLARETSNRSYPEIGVADPHHPTSHHGGDPEKVAKIAKINQFHVSLFAYYLEKLKATPDGDGTLLDHSMVLYGSGMGNPNVHDHVNLPIIVAGGAAGKMRGGRHLAYPSKQVPTGNLLLSVLHLYGIEAEKQGDSTGRLPKLV